MQIKKLLFMGKNRTGNIVDKKVNFDDSMSFTHDKFYEKQACEHLKRG
jgi:hypothetical protein